MSQFTQYSTATYGQSTEWVSALIDVCRETQMTYEVAAGGVGSRLLRAELLQYSGQRREFIAELINAAQRYGSQIIDPGSICQPLARQCEVLREAIGQNNTVAILAECERTDAHALEAYRQAFGLELPAALHAMINTQLSAIKRVRDRVHRLRLNAQSERN